MWNPFKKRIPKYIRQQIEEREKRQELAEECPYFIEPQYTSMSKGEQDWLNDEGYFKQQAVNFVNHFCRKTEVPEVFEDAFKDD